MRTWGKSACVCEGVSAHTSPSAPPPLSRAPEAGPPAEETVAQGHNGAKPSGHALAPDGAVRRTVCSGPCPAPGPGSGSTLTSDGKFDCN